MPLMYGLGPDGKPTEFITTTMGQIATIDYGEAVAKGIIDGVFGGYKFGKDPSANTSQSTIWPGTGNYPFPLIAQTLSIASTSANDTAAGTGARTAVVSYIDGDNNRVTSEEITLNGQTPVEITGEDGRVVRRVRVATAGSGKTNDGTLYVGYGTFTSGVPDNVLGIALPGDAKTLQAIEVVPAGFKMEMHSLFYSVGEGKSVELSLYVRPPGGVFELEGVWSVFEDTDTIPFYPPRTFFAGSDIDLRAQTAVSTTLIAGGFQSIFEPVS